MYKNVKKRARVFEKHCVACGVCAKNCPLQAISVLFGVHAAVDERKCVGCGKCKAACPASTIILEAI